MYFWYRWTLAFIPLEHWCNLGHGSAVPYFIYYQSNKSLAKQNVWEKNDVTFLVRPISRRGPRRAWSSDEGLRRAENDGTESSQANERSWRKCPAQGGNGRYCISITSSSKYSTSSPHSQNNCERQCTPCDRLGSSARKKDGRTFFHSHSFQSSTTTALGSHGQFSYRRVRA